MKNHHSHNSYICIDTTSKKTELKLRLKRVSLITMNFYSNLISIKPFLDFQ